MRLFVLIIVLMPALQAYSQSSDTIKQKKLNCSDSVFFQGYYVDLFQKSQLRELKRNRVKRLVGKPYQMPFEANSLIFFISIDSIHKSGFRSLINKISLGKNKELFVECTKEYPSMFSEALCLTKNELQNCDWPSFSSDNKYYTTHKRSKYCFKIYEIKGWFKKVKIDTEEERNSFGRRLKLIDPSVKEFDAYFFWKLSSYSNEITRLSKDIKLWKEIPSLFE